MIAELSETPAVVVAGDFSERRAAGNGSEITA